MIQLLPPVVTVDAVAERRFLQEEEVEELLPREATVLAASSHLHSILQLPLILDLKGSHEFGVLDELFDEFILGHVVLAFELLVTIFCLTLDRIEDPLEQEEGHFVFITDT